MWEGHSCPLTANLRRRCDLLIARVLRSSSVPPRSQPLSAWRADGCFSGFALAGAIITSLAGQVSLKVAAFVLSLGRFSHVPRQLCRRGRQYEEVKTWKGTNLRKWIG